MMNSVARQPKNRRRAVKTAVHSLGYNEHNGRLSLHNLTEARSHLPEFQRAFRERYGSHARPEELDVLESRETEVVEGLWPLWHAFVTQPGTTYKNPEEVLARGELDTLRWLRGRLESALRRVPVTVAKATVVSETVEWDDRPALWIGVELADPVQLLSGIEAVHGAAKAVFGRIKRDSLEAYVTERFWAHVLLVPTVGGKRMLPTVWRFATANFYLGYFVDESITWIPVPLLASTAPKLGIESLDFLARPELERFEAAWGGFYELVAHLADIERMPVESDESGDRIQNTYLAEIRPIAESRAHALDDALAALFEAVSSAAADREAPLLVEILDALEEIASGLPAPEKDEEEQLAVPWEARLRSAAGLLGAVRVALVAHTAGAEARSQPKSGRT